MKYIFKTAIVLSLVGGIIISEQISQIIYGSNFTQILSNLGCVYTP